jgi:hypothetical protein
MRISTKAIQIAALMLLALCVSHASPQANTVPAQLSDAEFWRIVSEFSEPDGPYTGDNWISNEASIQNVIPSLKRMTKTGGAYLGVGPEQNFTYIWAAQPKIAFIVDIRRQNLLNILMQKALFELSPDRAEFAARLFSRRRPQGLDEKTSPAALLAAIEAAPKTDIIENLQAIRSTLTKHGFTLSGDDLVTMDRVYQAFYRGGTTITAEFMSPGSPAGIPVTYTNHMTATDANKTNWSFLGSEEAYRYVREMHRKNLIIPLVGDFSGSKTMRQVAQYLKERNATVSAFYVSNVEMYLQGPKMRGFQQNIATLPIDTTSMLIRWAPRPVIPNVAWYNPNMGPVVTLLGSMTELVDQLNSGRAPATYEETLRASKDPETLVPLVQDPTLRRISGRVTVASALKANESLVVQLLENPRGAGRIYSAEVRPDGTFEFRNIQPRTYQAMVIKTCRNCDFADALGAGSAVVVADKDITGLQLAP